MNQAAVEVRPEDLAATIESVVIQGDLARLQPAERVSYYRSVCESLGLNQLTRPMEYLMLNGRPAHHIPAVAQNQPFFSTLLASSWFP